MASNLSISLIMSTNKLYQNALRLERRCKARLHKKLQQIYAPIFSYGTPQCCSCIPRSPFSSFLHFFDLMQNKRWKQNSQIQDWSRQIKLYYGLTFHLNLSSSILFWASVSFPTYRQISSPTITSQAMRNECKILSRGHEQPEAKIFPESWFSFQIFMKYTRAHKNRL